MGKILNTPVSPAPKCVEPCCGTGASGKKVFSVEYQKFLVDGDPAYSKRINVVALSYTQVEKYVLSLAEEPIVKIRITDISCYHEAIAAIL